MIDGVPIEQISIARMRASIGYVPQDSFLFSDSLRENIALGAEDDAADRAAEIARLAADVEEFPAGMETVVGERGVTLSGGQKQRTGWRALSSAILRS